MHVDADLHHNYFSYKRNKLISLILLRRRKDQDYEDGKVSVTKASCAMNPRLAFVLSFWSPFIKRSFNPTGDLCHAMCN